MMLVFRHPEWTADQIIDELVALGFDRPTFLLVNNVKRHFRIDLRFLIKAGVIDADARPTGPLHPDLIRKPKRKRYRRHFYAKDHD